MTRREMQQFVRDLRRDGFKIRLTGGGHHRITRPGRRGVAYTGSSPSDWRALKNLRAQLRKTLGASPT